MRSTLCHAQDAGVSTTAEKIAAGAALAAFGGVIVAIVHFFDKGK